MSGVLDTDARWAAEGDELFWNGYKIHVSETCDGPAGTGLHSLPRFVPLSAIAEPKQWRTLQRYTGRRDHFDQTALAIAGLVSDRCATR